MLLPKHLHKFTPHRNFAWMVHIDGLRERHDESVCKDGVFDQAVAAIKQAKAAGFRVMTNTTFFNTDTPQDVIDVLDYLNDELGVDNMQISPGYAYEKAPDQEHWLGVERDPRAVHEGVRRRPAQEVAAQPLAAVPRLPRGQARLRLHRVGHPVVLAAGLAEAVLPARRRLRHDLPGAASTSTDWDAFGRGKDPRCANCMAHCGYEPTAVLATMGSLQGVHARCRRRC